MTKKLEGKTAVITGGTEGIGLATGKLFVKEGVPEWRKNMKNVLELALEAHGGLTRWSELKAVTAAETIVRAQSTSQ